MHLPCVQVSVCLMSEVCRERREEVQPGCGWQDVACRGAGLVHLVLSVLSRLLPSHVMPYLPRPPPPAVLVAAHPGGGSGQAHPRPSAAWHRRGCRRRGTRPCVLGLPKVSAGVRHSAFGVSELEGWRGDRRDRELLLMMMMTPPLLLLLLLLLLLGTCDNDCFLVVLPPQVHLLVWQGYRPKLGSLERGTQARGAGRRAFSVCGCVQRCGACTALPEKAAGVPEG